MPPAKSRSAPSAIGKPDPVVGAVEPKLRKRLHELLDEHRLAGFSVGVVRDQELAWSAGFGYSDVDRGARPDAHTVYRVASISKTFTCLAIVQLRDRG